MLNQERANIDQQVKAVTGRVDRVRVKQTTD